MTCTRFVMLGALLALVAATPLAADQQPQSSPAAPAGQKPPSPPASGGQKPQPPPAAAGQKPSPPAAATGQKPPAAPAAAGQKPPAAPAGVTPPSDYVIGPEDLLQIQFWRDEQISGEAMVRPDGKITLKLLNDIQAAGLTPDQLREVLTKAATRYLEDPSVTVIVKQIRSRNVMVIGEVNKTGPLPLNGPMTVLMALGMAGGVTEYAKKSQIAVIRNEPGKVARRIPFDYEAVAEGKKLEQNIYLLPGDTVFVP